MTETANALDIIETASTDGLTQDIEQMKQGTSNVVSTFKGGDRSTKIEILKAMTSAGSLEELIEEGKELNLANWVIKPVTLVNEETGEVREVPRIILVDDKGASYVATSVGIFSALKDISAIMGMPGEENGMWPIKVKPKGERTRNGNRVFTLVITG